MKINNLIPLVIILGVIILFFFPSPESNFIFYLATFLFFIFLVLFLLFLSRKKLHSRKYGKSN